jgi:hypothetical protein
MSTGFIRGKCLQRCERIAELRCLRESRRTRVSANAGEGGKMKILSGVYFPGKFLFQEKFVVGHMRIMTVRALLP